MALCEERVKDWQKFVKLGYSCSILTGDSNHNETTEIQKSNIIITTPEKWDSMTRQWKDSKHLLRLVHLLFVDEIHFLKDGCRGATLEVVISRMKSMRKVLVDSGEYTFPNLRIIAISATIPNLRDFAEWLGSNGQRAKEFMFGEEYRSVGLSRYVFGYSQMGNPFSFEDNLKYKVMDHIKTYGKSKPTLVVIYI